MKLYSPCFTTLLEIEEGVPFLLAIENRALFRRFLEELHTQASGGAGGTVLSKDNVPISISKSVDVLAQFAPFEINTRTLLSKLCTAGEQVAVDETHYLRTAQMLSDVETYITDLFFDFPLGIECRKLDAGAFIKAASPAIAEDFVHPIEAILAYMSMVLTFERQKLFVTVNMHGYFDMIEMEKFAAEVQKKQLRILMLENSAYPILPGTKRLVIDNDLCEF